MRASPFADVRAAIARAMCGEILNEARGGALGDARVGDVSLFPHQREAVRRARASIGRFGGALLADDVGAGKTLVALAIAAAYTRPVVLAPAALRPMWTRAVARAALTIPFVSIESLGRGRPPPAGHDLVIVDEAHHLRNPATQRYAVAQTVVHGAHVLLASATPVHNVARDLDALLALFLRADAADLNNETRARVVIRSAEGAPVPRVEVHSPVAVRDDADVLGAIRRLPAPIRASDAGDAPALFRLALLRAWCSSVAAFDAMLAHASHAAEALVDAMRAGRALTRADLKAWSLEDGQLAFAELFGAPIVAAGGDSGRAIKAAAWHLEALRALRGLARLCHAFDDDRAEHVSAIRVAHEPVAVLACSQYAVTVNALWRRLRHQPGVAVLTSCGARIASGAISREDALRRFAPLAHGVRPPHERERIWLLVATDLVSEGLNLQDAGVVVHLDLPWTAARLAQRVGRVARMGSAYETVHVHTIAPPRAASALLALERRIRRKRALGARLVGGERRMAALLGGPVAASGSAAEAHAEIVEMLRPHARDGQTSIEGRGNGVVGSGQSTKGVVGSGSNEARETMRCAIRAPRAGWLALISGPHARLVAKLGSRAPTTDPRIVKAAVAQLVDATEQLDAFNPVRACAELDRWLANERARELAGAGRRNAARVHGRSIATTVGSVTATPPHERARAAVLAQLAMAEHASPPFQQRPTLPSRQSSIVNRHSAIPLLLVVFCSGDATTNRHSV